MNQNELIVCYIIEKESEIISLSLESIYDMADHIIIIDGAENKKDLTIIPERFNEKVEVIWSRYEHESKGSNGKQRNKYLKRVQELYNNKWCLVLDADEVIANPETIKPFIDFLEQNNINAISPKMRHFIGNLGFEDATNKNHYCMSRLFKIRKDLKYEEVEHPILIPNTSAVNTPFIIWHLGYSREIFNILKKYKNHLEKSNIHNPDYLLWWYRSHLFGKYPTSQIPPEQYKEFPLALKKHFLIEDIDDEVYFFNRMQLEVKHLLDAWNWKIYFNPKSAIEIGCGAGHRVFAMNLYGIDTYGIEKSKWVIEHTPYKDIKNKLIIGDIADLNLISKPIFDLTICYDLLEHISYEKIDIALNNIRDYGNKYFIFSIPFLNDPNLLNDPTHIIKETKEWWIKKIEDHGIKIKETPNFFYFKDQILIGEINAN